jgi:hypothetical protein
VRGSTVSNPGNLQPHVYACLGFRDHIVSAWNSTIMRTTGKTGMIRTIVHVEAA